MAEASIFEEILQVEKEGTRAVLVTVIETTGHTPQVPGARMLVYENRSIRGTVGGGAVEDTARNLAVEMLGNSAPSTLRSWHLLHDLGMCCGGKMTLFFEPLSPRPRLFLFGAGHVAQPTARLAGESGFSVQVIDDRPEWNNPQRFPHAMARHLVDYRDFVASFSPRKDDFVVVTTQGHEFDDLIVEHVARFPLRYLGMIGSTRKAQKTRRKLTAQGLPHPDTALHAPVGLSLGGETPAEIAVSIVAQMLAVRYGREPSAAAVPSESPILKDVE